MSQYQDECYRCQTLICLMLFASHLVAIVAMVSRFQLMDVDTVIFWSCQWLPQIWVRSFVYIFTTSRNDSVVFLSSRATRYWHQSEASWMALVPRELSGFILVSKLVFQNAYSDTLPKCQCHSTKELEVSFRCIHRCNLWDFDTTCSPITRSRGRGSSPYIMCVKNSQWLICSPFWICDLVSYKLVGIQDFWHRVMPGKLPLGPRVRNLIIGVSNNTLENITWGLV